MNAPAEARGLPRRRNVVTNVLGGDEQIEVHIAEWPRAPGRLLLLCTDGVHGVLDDGAHRWYFGQPGRAAATGRASREPKRLPPAAAITPRRWSWQMGEAV